MSSALVLFDLFIPEVHVFPLSALRPTSCVKPFLLTTSKRTVVLVYTVLTLVFVQLAFMLMLIVVIINIEALTDL